MNFNTATSSRPHINTRIPKGRFERISIRPSDGKFIIQFIMDGCLNNSRVWIHPLQYEAYIIGMPNN